MIRRQPDPEPEAHFTAARLARYTARHDQALAIIDGALRTHAGNRQLTDVILDIRNALDPPRR